MQAWDARWEGTSERERQTGRGMETAALTNQRDRPPCEVSPLGSFPVRPFSSSGHNTKPDQELLCRVKSKYAWPWKLHASEPSSSILKILGYLDFPMPWFPLMTGVVEYESIEWMLSSPTILFYVFIMSLCFIIYCLHFIFNIFL